MTYWPSNDYILIMSLREGNDRSRTGQEAAGLALIGLAVLTMAALISFNPLDPSPGQSGVMSPTVGNWVGLIGAYLAGGLVEMLGFTAFAAPLLIGWLGATIFRGRGSGLGLSAWIGLGLLIPCLSAWLSLLAGKTTWAGQAVQSGGWVGSLLTGVLKMWLKGFGAGLILTAGLLTGLMLAFDLSLSALIQAMTSKGGSLFSRIKTARIRVKDKQKKEASTEFKRLKESLEHEPPAIDIVETPPPPPPPKPKPVQKTFEFMAGEGEGEYRAPGIDMLGDPPEDDHRPDQASLEHNSKLLEKKLFDFGIQGQVKAVHPGPVITMYEYEPAPGVKISKIVNLADDLSMALRAMAIRIVAPLPGKGTIGIEIPNAKRQIVMLKDLLIQPDYHQAKDRLTLALGKDIFGVPYFSNLAKMPHLLIAGATGSGKSVCINTILMSILYRSSPDQVKLILVDPKRIELTMYDGLPHLLHPVLTDPKSATRALRWAVSEMENRYDMLAWAGVRSIDAYNSKKNKNDRLAGQTEEEVEPLPDKLPYLVIIIDELADLMMVSSKEVEESIIRLAQMARAAGIHLILATQRPSVDVITGIIKANFPARIAFQVAQKTDSRTIIDSNGAESLLGMGDMLFLPPGVGKLTRLHCAFVSDSEVRRVTDHLRSLGRPNYDESMVEATTSDETTMEFDDEDVDERYPDAVRVVTSTGKASISMVQRKLRVGYNRAARMIERMAAEGIVSEPDHTNTRRVLINSPDEGA